MDRVPSPEDAFRGLHECDDATSNGVHNGEATGEFPEFRDEGHFSYDSFPIHDHVDHESLTERPALGGRPDIDIAMVDALHHAMDSDPGVRSSTWVASSRGDIDTAMVEALRHAMVRDPSTRHA